MTTSKQEMIDKANELLAAASLLPDDKPKSWPQIGGSYWCLDTDGDMYKSHYEGDAIDIGRCAQGNVFKTEAEAICKRDVNAATVIVEARIKELNDGWVDGLGIANTLNHLIILREGELAIVVASVIQHRPSTHYIRNYDLCEQLIRELPKELHLMIEG